MPTLLKDINEASFRVKYGIDELALIKLCQRFGVVAREPPQCPRCNSAINGEEFEDDENDLDYVAS